MECDWNMVWLVGSSHASRAEFAGKLVSFSPWVFYLELSISDELQGLLGVVEALGGKWKLGCNLESFLCKKEKSTLA